MDCLPCIINHELIIQYYYLYLFVKDIAGPKDDISKKMNQDQWCGGGWAPIKTTGVSISQVPQTTHTDLVVLGHEGGKDWWERCSHHITFWALGIIHISTVRFSLAMDKWMFCWCLIPIPPPLADDVVQFKGQVSRTTLFAYSFANVWFQIRSELNINCKLWHAIWFRPIQAMDKMLLHETQRPCVKHSGRLYSELLLWAHSFPVNSFQHCKDLRSPSVCGDRWWLGRHQLWGHTIFGLAHIHIK